MCWADNGDNARVPSSPHPITIFCAISLSDDIIDCEITVHWRLATHALAGETMSLQVNLSSPDITNAYQDILNARGIVWVVLTYDKASNVLTFHSPLNCLAYLHA